MGLPVDPASSPTFNAIASGRSVLMFADGPQPDEQSFPVVFAVIESRRWDDTLDLAAYPDARVYNQPDRSLPK